MWGADALGVRRLEALINALPRDSATVRALDPEIAGRGWDTKTELLATIAELIDQNTRMFIIANSKKGAMPPQPIRIPRPGRVEVKKPEPVSSIEAMNRMFASGVQVYKEETSV